MVPLRSSVASAAAPATAPPRPMATPTATASGVASYLDREFALTVRSPVPLASTNEWSMPARVAAVLVLVAQPAAADRAPAASPNDPEIDAAAASAVTVRLSSAETRMPPLPEVTPCDGLSELMTRASTVPPTSFLTIAAATAPEIATAPPANDADTPTPETCTSVEATDVTDSMPDECAFESSMRARTVVLTVLSALTAPNDSPTPTAPTATLTATASPVESTSVSSDALTVSVPACAS